MNNRSTYWKPFIVREVAVVLALAWYIKVELLRTKQLPQHFTYSRIDRAPLLKADIFNQARAMYGTLYRSDDHFNKFCIQDTGKKHLDGKIGMIRAYDTVNECFDVNVSKTNHWSASHCTEMSLSPKKHGTSSESHCDQICAKSFC